MERRDGSLLAHVLWNIIACEISCMEVSLTVIQVGNQILKSLDGSWYSGFVYFAK